MTVINFASKPLAVHTPFHLSTAYERACFGAFGSGKTYALIDEAIAWCLEQPGIRGGIFRKTVPELRDTTEPIFFERLPAELRAAGEVRRHGGHHESFTFPNGSVVLFRSLDDWNKHRSLNLGFMAIDEANEIDEDTYNGMKSRVRQKDLTAEAKRAGYTGEITRRGIWVATNPNGKDWLFKHFVAEMGNVPAENTAYFKSTSFDNPFLAPDTLRTYMSFPEPWIRRYVLCTFDEFGGQIYEDWNWEDHVVEPYDLPPQNVVWMGMDPGTRNPTAGLWVHVDREKRTLTGIAEYEHANRPAIAHGMSWRKLEAQKRMNVRTRIADPNINTKDRGTNMELSSLYSRAGFYFQLGPRMHKVRIPSLGQLISLGRFKVTKECPKTYEAIKNYQWADLTPAQIAKGEDPKEEPLKKGDHLVDCAQYVASRWVAPVRPDQDDSDKTPHQQLSADIHKAVAKQLRSKARRRSHPLAPLNV